MSIIRVEKTKDYTIMSNIHLREKEMSLKAKGLLSIMLSLPEDWDYSVIGLTFICKEGKDSIISALQELEKFGYLERNQIRQKDGKLNGIEYIVHEHPTKPQKEDNPDVPDETEPEEEYPDAENPPTGNPPQSIINKSITDKSIINKSKKEIKKKNPMRHKYGEYHNVLLSDEELEKLKAEFPKDWKTWIERLDSYIEQSGKKYKSHLATIRNWERKDRDKNTKPSYSQEDYSFKGEDGGFQSL